MKDRELFNLYASEFGEYKAFADYEYIRILKLMGITSEPPGQKVLDIGCGSGVFSGFLSDLGFEVVGIDISDGLIKVGKKNLANKNVKLIWGNFLEYNFNEKFDIIFCADIIHHLIKNIEQVVEKIDSLLKPGGKLYIFEPPNGLRHKILVFLHTYLGKRKLECTEEEDAIDVNLLDKMFLSMGYKKVKYVTIMRIKERKPIFKKFLMKVFYNFKKIFSYWVLPHPHVIIKYIKYD